MAAPDLVSAVEALVFDTYGTVVDWRGSVLAELGALGRSRGLTVDWEAFLADWRACYRPGMERVNRGDVPWATVEQIYRAGLHALLPRYAIVGLDDADLERLVRAWWRLRPWPDAVPGLTRLRRHYVIGPLSNASFVGMVRLAKFAGLPWDCIITAENVGWYKPRPEVYRTAVSLLGLRPAQVMLVAAHNYDLHAAQAEGLRTAFVPRRTEYGPDQTTDLTPDGDWDVIATDFLALATILGARQR